MLKSFIVEPQAIPHENKFHRKTLERKNLEGEHLKMPVFCIRIRESKTT